MGESSEICSFYKDTNILITGGTGFLGKILIEKLLRSTDVSTVYLLIRARGGMSAQQRFEELFKCEVRIITTIIKTTYFFVTSYNCV